MGAKRLCFLLFCLFLESVSSLRKLKDIDDLKNITYAKSAPRHGLQLLFWFAQKVVAVDQKNALLLDSNFDPNRGDFGFHHYGNREDMFPSMNSWHSYMVGNLKSPKANALPAYVRKYYRNTNVPERNMDRLIFSVKQNKPNKIVSVFITAYDRHKNNFNLADTYEIDPALLLKIGSPYICTANISDNSDINTVSRNTEDTEYDRCHQFLTEMGYDSSDCKHSHISRRKKRSPYLQCNAYDEIKLQIKTTREGFTKLIWEIPPKIPENSKYVYIEICQNTHFSETNEVHSQVRKRLNIYKPSGAIYTDVSLNAGLQPRLRLYPSLFDFQFTNAYIWYGPEFDGANGVSPTKIKRYGASLQLYTEYGKACARLYIKKTFTDWKHFFYYSWVGFYKNKNNKNNDYSTYQYARKFEKIENSITPQYDIYQYISSLAIAPGVQIRFQLDKEYDKVLAQTTPWEGVEEVTILPSDCLLPTVLINMPEFFYGPEHDNIGLQLYTEDNKACAKLYIKKTLTDWKDTFYYSWVGFYTSSQNKNDGYYDYHYVVKFDKMAFDNDNYDIYQYKSKLAIAPGVQIRFLRDKSSDYVLVKTEPWKNGK